jgi:DNA-binding transcriptional MerR regulator
MDTLVSTGQASKMLGVPTYKITYAHATGKVREPSRIFGKRAYRKSDLSALAEHFKVQLIEPTSRESAKETNGRT